MYTLFVDMDFKAQHQLSFADGTQEPLHEHNWNVCATVSAKELDDNELIIDFEELKSMLSSILQDLRGQRLESLGAFEHRNVSAETLARTLYNELAPKLPRTVRLDSIEVTEAPGCRARYSP
ncbi:MAG: 6-pyruvoyl trahydropterin synthase family protein [Planctomycetota bacterium]|jgi:6-pyruvoyltetrahydropterin/6-carboxytetrahydropterin synthase